MEFDVEPHGLLEHHVVQSSWRNDLMFSGRDDPWVVGSVLEHEPQRTFFHHEATPDIVRHRMCGAQTCRCGFFAECRSPPLQLQPVGQFVGGRFVVGHPVSMSEAASDDKRLAGDPTAS